MKKYLSIYTLLALACIVLQSCLFSEEEIFDDHLPIEPQPM